MAGAKKVKAGKASWLILGPALLLAFTFLLPTTLLIIGGLLPSVLSYMADREKGKLMTLTVTSLNFTALIPIIMRLWDRGQTLDNATALLANPLIWFLVLLGAMFGWVLAQVVPSLVVSIIAAKDRRLLDKIRARQKTLIEEWGPDVAENGPK